MEEDLTAQDDIYVVRNRVSDTVENDADVHTGDFRPIDLTREPFGFSAPVHRMADDAISENRSLAVWRVRDLLLR